MSPPADTLPHHIRPLVPYDQDIVCKIDRDAFETHRRSQHQSARPLRLRTPENIRTAILREQPGIVIESPPGRPVGYCFTHIWGKVGWLGTLGIAPPYQGLGLGRAVIAAGLDLLREAGCETLTLETMPESGKNLALYTLLGLDAYRLTVLCQGTPKSAAQTRFEIWEDDSAIRDVASQLVPGLDPTPAAVWLKKEGAGETLIWYEHHTPIAFAILRTIPRRQQGLLTYITVEVAACVPEAAHRWPHILNEIQTYARSLSKLGVVLPVNTNQAALLRQVLGYGMHIVHTRVRMTHGAMLGSQDAILMLTLAM
ncbi:MAG: GNAT family N-acetyltransferase [Anaerolineae bacterium]|nr:GNAT family N-acetyltransferase [Anaerolineae bacterium]